jgi:hypothetical protein
MLQSRILANLETRTSQWPPTNERSSRRVAARYAGNYQVWLLFNDGRKKLVDLADELHGAIFEPLRDRERFTQLYLDCELATIAWEHGAEFAAE